MQKAIEKWYFSLVLVPVIINYLTDLIPIPKILSNWEITAIGSLTFLSIILTFELIAEKRNNKLNKKDVEIINKLLSIIDVDQFQEEIFDAHAGNGYPQRAIRSAIDFTNQSLLLTNLTTDKKLNRLIENFTTSLRAFLDFSGMNLFGERDDYKPDRNAYNSDLEYEQAMKKMDNLTDSAFDDLFQLIEYAKSRRYI